MRSVLGVMGDNDFDLEEVVVVLKVCSGTAGPADWWTVWEMETSSAYWEL